MTAEIAILNRSAVALGADSAATITRRSGRFGTEQKVLKGANKVFALCRHHPVGVMIFGDANFMGVPWETVIKLYRAECKNPPFQTLKEYTEDFFGFLEKHKTLFPKTSQDEGAFDEMANNAINIRAQVEGEARQKEEETGHRVGKRERNKILADYIGEIKAYLEGASFLPQQNLESAKASRAKFKDDLDIIIEKVFEKFTISKPNKSKLRFILIATITRQWFKKAASGLVFAGFGEEEHFPRLYAYECKGLFEGVFSRVQSELVEISDRSNEASAIIPFAQTEMVKTFMNGIDPDFEPYISETLSGALQGLISEAKNIAGAAIGKQLAPLASSIVQNFNTEFERFRETNHYDPMKAIVDVLPKDDLAELAETLIIMESLKKRVTMPIESVGGPVDVAVISKGEGLIWIKRKHYFDLDKNHHYLERIQNQ